MQTKILRENKKRKLSAANMKYKLKDDSHQLQTELDIQIQRGFYQPPATNVKKIKKIMIQ